MSKLKALLQEMLDAPQNNPMQSRAIDFDITGYHCGTAACLCGDVAMARNPRAALFLEEDLDEGADAEEALNTLVSEAMRFDNHLLAVCREELGVGFLAIAITSGFQEMRRSKADHAGLFTDGELSHPHLTKYQPSREEAHDFVRLVVTKLDALEMQQQ